MDGLSGDIEDGGSAVEIGGDGPGVDDVGGVEGFFVCVVRLDPEGSGKDEACFWQGFGGSGIDEEFFGPGLGDSGVTWLLPFEGDEDAFAFGPELVGGEVNGPPRFHSDEFECSTDVAGFDVGDGEGLVILAAIGWDQEEFDGVAVRQGSSRRPDLDLVVFAMGEEAREDEDIGIVLVAEQVFLISLFGFGGKVMEACWGWGGRREGVGLSLGGVHEEQ